MTTIMPTIIELEADSYLSCLLKRFSNYLEDICSSSQYFFIGRRNKIFIFLSLLCAITAGLCPPAMIIVFSRLVEQFVIFVMSKKVEQAETNPEELKAIVSMKWLHIEKIKDDTGHLYEVTHFYSAATATLASIMFLTISTFVLLLNSTVKEMVRNARYAYFKAIIFHELAWFDLQDPIELAANLIIDVNKLEEGLGEKLGFLMMNLTTTFFSLVCAFFFGSQMALILLGTIPGIYFIKWLSAKAYKRLKKREDTNYFKAEFAIQEIFANLHQVRLNGGEEHEIERYRHHLKSAEMSQVQTEVFFGLFEGLVMFAMYTIYAVAFWHGVTYILDAKSKYTTQNLISVFFCIKMALVTSLKVKIYFKMYIAAKVAASKIICIIEHKTILLVESLTLKNRFFDSTDLVVFENVSFTYPARPNHQAVKSCSFQINPREHVVFTGPFGGGKTTIMRLVHRLYDPQFGRITLDGVSLKEIDINWLRWHVGYVSNKPLLTGSTMYECIICDALDQNNEDVVRIAKLVGLHEEILRMPAKYKTPISTDLTLAQQQRLAIARLLIRNPVLIILDNATSALSRDEEAALYKQLRKITVTIITITARISLMRSADLIFYMFDGAITEFGTFDSLLKNKSQFGTIVGRMLEAMKLKDPDDIIEDLDDSSLSPALTHLYGVTTFHVHRYRNRVDYSQQEVVQMHVYRGTMFVNSLEPNPISLPIKIADYKAASTARMLSYNIREWAYLLIGSCAALLVGLSLPTYAILFGECLSVIATQSEHEVKKVRMEFYTELFLLAGIIVGGAVCVQTFMIGLAGAKLTTRLRISLLRTMLRQELSWFDTEMKDMITLCTILRSDAANAHNIAGEKLVKTLQITCTLVASTLLGAYYNWSLGLVVLAMTPVMLLGLYMHSSILVTHTLSENEELFRARLIAQEAFANISSVISIGQELYYVDLYQNEIDIAYHEWMLTATKRALIYGVCLALPYYMYAATMYYGGMLLQQNDIQFGDLFKVTESLILGTILIGQIITYAPNIIKYRVSAAKVLKILKRLPHIPKHPIITLSHMEPGDIEFWNIEFVPVTSKKVPMLRKVNVTVPIGKAVALVGKPGSGVEVLIPLLLRLYQQHSGVISINGINIENIPLQEIRQKICVANGNAVFFNRTIAENIAYGDVNQPMRMDDVVCAAKEANLHNFITTLSDGYETIVRTDPSNLTLSQRFRLSLARALLRDPRILIVEYAYASESEESEELIRDAMRKARLGRTVLVSSHDLQSFIQDMDTVILFHKGGIYDVGTHKQLLEHKSLYHRIYMRQINDIVYKEKLQAETVSAYLRQREDSYLRTA